MADTLIKVADEKETLLKPIEATYEVKYKYEGEEEVTVKEGDVTRGVVKGEEFPAKDPAKDLEFSEVIIKVPELETNLSYAGKTYKLFGKIPDKNLIIKLPFKGKRPKNKEEKQEAMLNKKEALLERLRERFPPAKGK